MLMMNEMLEVRVKRSGNVCILHLAASDRLLFLSQSISLHFVWRSQISTEIRLLLSIRMYVTNHVA